VSRDTLPREELRLPERHASVERPPEGRVPETPPPAPTPAAHVPLLTLFSLTHLIVDAYATTVPALLPFWQARFGLSYGLAGSITAIANVTSSVAQPVVGLITERGRDARWVALACAVTAVGIGLTGLAPSFPVFLALVVVGGLGVSAFHPQGYKLVGVYAGARPAVATSWFLVGGNVGVAVGPIAGTAAAVAFGPSGTAALIPAGLLMAGALLWLVPRWTRAPRVAPAAPAAGAGTILTEAPATPATPVPPPAVAGLSLTRRTWAIVTLVAIVALRSTVSGVLTSFVPLYYVDVVGAPATEGSRVLAGMLLIGAVGTVAGGYLAERAGRMPVLAVSLALTPPLVLLFLALPPGSAQAVAALWAAGAMLTASFSLTVVLAQELWFERRALASGVIVGFAFGLGGLLVPLFGAVADRQGLTAAFQLVAIVPLLALGLTGVLILLLRPR
jgi:MFS transporter, FSR family, fosmidomycin resistance protein